MTPTQADREAAMMIRRLTAATLQEAGFIVSGIDDPEDDALIQAFTRHRLAAEAAAFEKAAGVAESVSVAVPLTAGCADGASIAQHAIISAIRKLAGEKHG